MKNLVIDIGNNRTKLGLFENANLVAKEVLSADQQTKILEWLTNHQPKNIILSTVGQPLPAELEQQIRSSSLYFIKLSQDTPLPIQNQYQTPETLGKDRIAAVIGASVHFPQEHCVIIDAGTCITYEVLHARKGYLGGNIAPGLYMRYKAMHEFTANLPLVENEEVLHIIGYSTKSAMQNGGQLGCLYEIEGFVADMELKIGQLNVILTGGDADFFAKKMKRKIFVHHNLVLEGLNKILSYNVERLE
ncbi:MAG: type III pantothenate kinase [Saprospiraceae bacterium]|jgi:type III pantothenate kinase|nr:type III pantothenate kinase [Saprospiraceae bacterium]